VREVVPELRRDGRVRHAYLGVSTTENPAGNGALLADVPAGSPADDGGLRKDDVVTSIDGRNIRAPEDLTGAVADHEPGDTVRVEVLRDGRRVELRIKLGNRPARASTP
jgi:putative serine protease PepD